MQKPFGSDGLKKMLDMNWVEGMKTQFGTYEERAREWVHNLDLKTRDAREQSKKKIEMFSSQLQKRRKDVEKRVKSLINQESTWLNGQVGDLVKYVKSVALSEKAAAPKKSVKKTARKTKAKSKKSSTGRKAVLSSSESVGAHPAM